MRSISCSAAAIFSADEGWGRPSPNIDMIVVLYEELVEKRVVDSRASVL